MLLNLKYRPCKFSDILGQPHLAKILKKAVELNKLAPAYLFVGPSGMGKTSGARVFAMAILCNDLQDGEPCGKCEACTEILDGISINYREQDSASQGSVEDMRKLVEQSSYGAIRGKRNIVYLDEAHMLTRAGQNAILKLLEDGSKSTTYILATTDPDKILHTVRARCMELRIRPIDVKDIADRLEWICKEEGISYEREALDVISVQTKSHVRDAINQMEQLHQLGDLTIASVKENLNLHLEAQPCLE